MKQPDKSEKSKSILTAKGKKSKKQNNHLKDWYWQNSKNLWKNLQWRIAILVLCGVVLVGLIFLVPYTLNLQTGWFSQIIFLLYIFLGFYVFTSYGYKSFLQILSDFALNASIYDLREAIALFNKPDSPKNLNVLQIRINRVRMNVKELINSSQIRSPPLYNYELNRLQKGIDIFFNSASEALFPPMVVFSKAEKIEQQQSIEYYQSEEHPTIDELAEEFEAAKKREEGVIEWFDYSALDEFLQFLGDSLFAPSQKFPTFSIRHPINLIMLSRFFGYWNSVLRQCKNCGDYEKVQKDVEKYYKQINERNLQLRQRMWGLRDSTIIVILTVILTTISTLVIQFLLK